LVKTNPRKKEATANEREKNDENGRKSVTKKTIVEERNKGVKRNEKVYTLERQISQGGLGSKRPAKEEGTEKRGGWLERLKSKKGALL